MEGSQTQLDAQNWGHAGYPGSASDRISDIIVVLSGLREEVEGLEAEIQKVETELLSDADNKVLNRKYERLLEEKRNKEARRERLELQLAAPPDHLYPAAPSSQGLLAHQPELHIHHPYYQLHASGKRLREDGQHEIPNLQGYMQGISDGGPPQAQQPPKGTGRGGKGGHKFCKRCKERITYGHQQKCKFCRKCYDESKELVLRSECPHGHDTASQPTLLLGNGPLEQHQAVLEAQQHQLQLQMQAAGQIEMAHLMAPSHHMQHHQGMPHVLAHGAETQPGQDNQNGHPGPQVLAAAEGFQNGLSQQALTQPLHPPEVGQRLGAHQSEPPTDSAFGEKGGGQHASTAVYPAAGSPDDTS